MDTLLTPDGDFELGENGLPKKIEDTKEILQKVLISLTVKKGSFIYQKNLGSELYKVKSIDSNSQSIKEEAEIEIKKIICKIPQLKFKSVSVEHITNSLQKTLKFTVSLIINNNEETMVVKI